VTDVHGRRKDPDQLTVYQVRLQGHLGRVWSDSFAGLNIVLEENGDTLLIGQLDQAALHGLLKRVRDLGMPLVSVKRVEPSQAS
jgi:hypothetical protein